MKEEVKSWVIKAFEDYKLIKHEIKLSEEEMITTVICFHSQQFVEKLFKAYLILKSREFPRTHNLGFLKTLCEDEDKVFESIYRAI